MIYLINSMNLEALTASIAHRRIDYEILEYMAIG